MRLNKWYTRAVEITTTGAAIDADGSSSIVSLSGSSSGRTVTSISNGSAGSWIILLFTDGNVRIDHGANLKLQGAANFTGAAGDVMFLGSYDGTEWRELSARQQQTVSAPATTLASLTVTGATALNGTVGLGDAGADTITFNGFVAAAGIQIFDAGIKLSSPADGKVKLEADGASTDDITLSGTVTLDDDLITPTDKKIGFRDSGLFINSPADGKLQVSADGSGADDITLAGTVTLTDDLITPTDKKIQFRDTGLFINSGADGKLTISADGVGADDITLAGSVTASDTLAVTGVTTPTGGIAAAGGFTALPSNFHTGGIPAQVSTDGTDTTPVVTETYIAAVFVPCNCTITGARVFLGSATEGNIKVGLADSAGAVVATSASTDCSGATVDAYFEVAFTGTYAAKGPATYYVLLLNDNTGNRFNSHAFGAFPASKKTGEVYATGFTTITPPTTFTADLGPIATLY